MFATCLSVIVREGQLCSELPITACGSSRSVTIDAMETVFAGGDPAVAADEVHVVGPLHQQLGHDGVVVVGLSTRGNRCIAWCRAGPRTVCGTLVLKAMPLRPSRGDRLLLDVDRFAVAVVGADVDGARRPGRADAVARDVAVAGQHEHIVAQASGSCTRRSCALTSPS